MDETRREAIRRLIGDLGEIQARLLHLVLDERKPEMTSDPLARAVDALEATVESLRKAAAGEP